MPRHARRLPLENLFAAAGRAAAVTVAVVATVVAAVRTAGRDGARHCEPPEKEIAIVAQEVINANHPQQQGRVRVAPAHARTVALGAVL